MVWLGAWKVALGALISAGVIGGAAAAQSVGEDPCREAIRLISDDATNIVGDEQAVYDKVLELARQDYPDDADTIFEGGLKPFKIGVGNDQANFARKGDDAATCYLAESVPFKLEPASAPKRPVRLVVDFYLFADGDLQPTSNLIRARDYAGDTGQKNAPLGLHHAGIYVLKNGTNKGIGASKDYYANNENYVRWAYAPEDSTSHFVVVLCENECSEVIRGFELDGNIDTVETVAGPPLPKGSNGDTGAIASESSGQMRQASPIDQVGAKSATPPVAERAGRQQAGVAESSDVASEDGRSEPYKVQFIGLNAENNEEVEIGRVRLGVDCPITSADVDTTLDLLLAVTSPDCMRLAQNSDWKVVESDFDSEFSPGVVEVAVIVAPKVDPVLRGIDVAAVMATGDLPDNTCALTYEIRVSQSADNPFSGSLVGNRGDYSEDTTSGIFGDGFDASQADGLRWEDVVLTLRPFKNDRVTSSCRPAKGQDSFDLARIDDYPQLTMSPEGRLQIEGLELVSTRPDLFVFINGDLGLPAQDGEDEFKPRYPWTNEKDLKGTVADFLKPVFEVGSGSKYGRVFVAQLGDGDQMSELHAGEGGTVPSAKKLASEVAAKLTVRDRNYSDLAFKTAAKRFVAAKGGDAGSAVAVIFGRSGFDAQQNPCVVDGAQEAWASELYQFDVIPKGAGTYQIVKDGVTQLDAGQLAAFDCEKGAGEHWLFAFNEFLDPVKELDSFVQLMEDAAGRIGE